MNLVLLNKYEACWYVDSSDIISGGSVICIRDPLNGLVLSSYQSVSVSFIKYICSKCESIIIAQGLLILLESGV